MKFIVQAFLVLFLFLLPRPAFALKEYYSLSRSVRALGMGNAFYGLSDDDGAMFYNPAGVALYRGKGQWMINIPGAFVTASPGVFGAISKFTNSSDSGIRSIIDRIESYRNEPLYVGITPIYTYYIRKNFSLGLLLGDTKANVALLGSELSTTVDVTAITDFALLGTFAKELREGLQIGFTPKVVYRAGGKKTFSLVDIEQQGKLDLNPDKLGGTGMGFDLDIGSMYELPFSPGLISRASITFSNLLGSQLPLARRGGNPPALPRMVSVGTHTIFAGKGPIDNFIFVLDFAEFGLGGQNDPDFGARGGSFWKHVNFGLEMPMSWFVLRTGFHQGNISAGFGIIANSLHINFATYGEEELTGVGRLTSRRYALQIKLGFGGRQPVPVTSRESYKTLPTLPVEEPKVSPKAEPKPPTPVPTAPAAAPATEMKKADEPSASDATPRVPNSEPVSPDVPASAPTPEAADEAPTPAQ